MTAQNRNEVVFTPEQQRILGQVYQLILSWRRERLNCGGKLLHLKSTENKDSLTQFAPDPTSPYEEAS
ncbi:MAG: hypothetical protein HRF47_17275 [Chloroflexota bacterium]|jgi:hypothetical protein